MTADPLLSTGSADRCLKIPEIVDLVLKELYTSRGYSPAHTWVGLAVTSHSFTESALNILWRELDGLIPLFKLLPREVWQQKFGGIASSTITRLLRDPTPTEWTKLRRYNWRILRLRLPGSGSSFFYPSTPESPTRRLCELCPYKLLPSVLEVELFSHANLAHLMPYFGNNSIQITHISFVGNHFYYDKKEFCSLVVQHCGQLQTLHLVDEVAEAMITEEEEDEEFDHWTKMLENLPNLQDVQLTNQNLLNSVVVHLGGLQHLRKLDLNRGPIINQETGRLLASSNTLFNQLESLRAWIVDWEAAETTFRSLQCPFRFLSLTINETPDHLSGVVANTIYNLLSNPTLGQSLTSLSLTACPASYLPGEPRTTEYRDDDEAIRTTFSQLHSLTALRQLTLRGIFFGRFDDAWLDKAARSWPHLRELRLYGLPTSPKPTLAGLIPFVKNCPYLESLAMTATWKPFDLGLLDEGIRNSSITSLDAFGPLVDVQGTSSCLKQLFPRLQRVKPAIDDRDSGPWIELDARIRGGLGLRRTRQ